MLPWFAPVLAQLITLDVKDRNEARYVVALDRRYEATTRPGALLSFKWPHYDLALGYDVSFLVTPLERTPRTLVVFNGAQLDTAYQLQHTTLSLSSFASWGEVNFLTAPLQSPAPTPAENPDNAGEPAPGEPAQPTNGGAPNNGANQGLTQTRAVNSVVRYQTSSTTLRLTQQVNRQLKLGAFTRYTMAGGLDDASLTTYPRTSGTTVGVDGTFTWTFTKRDTFLTNNISQHTWSSNGNVATSILATEVWTHRFNRSLATQLGAGISMTRISQTDGLTAYSIFPDFLGGVLYQTRLGRVQVLGQLGADDVATQRVERDGHHVGLDRQLLAVRRVVHGVLRRVVRHNNFCLYNNWRRLS